jgi:hypothetical protein
MLRYASSLVVAAYSEVRLTPQNSRALPAGFLRSRPKSKAFVTFYEGVIFDGVAKKAAPRGHHPNNP